MYLTVLGAALVYLSTVGRGGLASGEGPLPHPSTPAGLLFHAALVIAIHACHTLLLELPGADASKPGSRSPVASALVFVISFVTALTADAAIRFAVPHAAEFLASNGVPVPSTSASPQGEDSQLAFSFVLVMATLAAVRATKSMGTEIQRWAAAFAIAALSAFYLASGHAARQAGLVRSMLAGGSGSGAAPAEL
jgi:hypothetical protein